MCRQLVLVVFVEVDAAAVTVTSVAAMVSSVVWSLVEAGLMAADRLQIAVLPVPVELSAEVQLVCLQEVLPRAALHLLVSLQAIARLLPGLRVWLRVALANRQAVTHCREPLMERSCHQELSDAVEVSEQLLHHWILQLRSLMEVLVPRVGLGEVPLDLFQQPQCVP